MYRKLLTVLAALCMAVAGSVGLAASASAGPLGMYRVTNTVPATQFFARCWDANFNAYKFGPLNYGDSTLDADCNYFSVGDNRAVLYRSDATQTYYWSGCGRYLPHTESGFGWQHIGNNVHLVDKKAC